MAPIEILAAIFGILVILKLLLTILKPELRAKIAESFLSQSPSTLTIIYLVLTAVIGYYVFSSLSITETAAVMMLMSALMGLFYSQYPAIMRQLLKESLKPKFLRRNLISFLVWAGLAVWALYEVFLK